MALSTRLSSSCRRASFWALLARSCAPKQPAPSLVTWCRRGFLRLGHGQPPPRFSHGTPLPTCSQSESKKTGLNVVRRTFPHLSLACAFAHTRCTVHPHMSRTAGHARCFCHATARVWGRGGDCTRQQAAFEALLLWWFPLRDLLPDAALTPHFSQLAAARTHTDQHTHANTRGRLHTQ
jgi:hypothetical protein